MYSTSVHICTYYVTILEPEEGVENFIIKIYSGSTKINFVKVFRFEKHKLIMLITKLINYNSATSF